MAVNTIRRRNKEQRGREFRFKSTLQSEPFEVLGMP
jgi:hypothetical protein